MVWGQHLVIPLRSRIFELVVCEGELLHLKVDDEPQSSSMAHVAAIAPPTAIHIEHHAIQ